MAVPAQYRAAHREMDQPAVKCRRGRPKSTIGKNHSLLEYIAFKPTLPKPQYLLRFRRFTPHLTEFAYSYFDADSLVYYGELPSFTGFFEDLVALNENIIEWAQLERLILKDPAIHGLPFLHDLFFLELFRIQLGIQNYSQYERIMRAFHANPITNYLIGPHLFPTAKDLSAFYHHIPEPVFETLFHTLADEIMEEYRLPRKILIWDGQFMHSNASDYKKPGQRHYSDPDTDVATHDNKFLGVGYYCSTLYAYCGDFLIPVECIVVPGNTSDKRQLPLAWEAYSTRISEKPKVVLSDAGPYSKALVHQFLQEGILFLISVPKTVKKEALAISPTGTRFLKTSVPSNWSVDDLQCVYNVRSAIERAFSHNNLVYNADILPVRTLDQAQKHRYMLLILDLLKIKTALAIGRSDLVMCSTAFSECRGPLLPFDYQDTLRSHLSTFQPSPSAVAVRRRNLR